MNTRHKLFSMLRERVKPPIDGTNTQLHSKTFSICSSLVYALHATDIQHAHLKLVDMNQEAAFRFSLRPN